MIRNLRTVLFIPLPPFIIALLYIEVILYCLSIFFFRKHFKEVRDVCARPLLPSTDVLCVMRAAGKAAKFPSSMPNHKFSSCTRRHASQIAS